MVISRATYGPREVEAAQSVLVELVHVLGEYRDHIVVVGGWVPHLILPDSADPHVGSLDVDLALDHRAISHDGYKTIEKLLLEHGYYKDPQSDKEPQPFVFYRDVPVGDQSITVEVDFLAGEYDGTGKSHRTQRVQDIRPRKARGCDLAFDAYEEVAISGELPGGGQDSVVVRVAGIVPFLVMKAMALRDRLKQKDAYDIHFCLSHYPGGLDALVEAFRPYVGHGLVREGMAVISEKFSSPNHIGPRHVADFNLIEDSEDRAIVQQDVYQRVRYLLDKLGKLWTLI